LVGVTNDSLYKLKIVEEIRLILNGDIDVIPMWSKYRVENRRTGESYFQLYFLKNNADALKVSHEDVTKCKAEIPRFSDVPQLLLWVTEDIAKQWNHITKKVSLNGQGYLAFVLDDEVYCCPYVAEPITGDIISMAFESLSDAQIMSKRIKSSR
jgi:hypothetical protein